MAARIRVAFFVGLVGLVGLVACFEESAPTQTCPPGGAGCECRPGDMCDGQLECRDPGVCVEPNCTPGTLGCLCDDGMCTPGAECSELGACVQPSPSTTGNDTTMSADATSSSSTTVSSAEGTGTGSATSGTSTTSPGSTTSSGNECTSECLQTGLRICAGMDLACDADCEAVFACMYTCNGDSNCFGQCCDGASISTRAAVACALDECPTCQVHTKCSPMG
jgi:hypothetical protein